MKAASSHARSIPRQAAPIAAALAVSGGALALAWHLRLVSPDPAPLALPELPRLLFDPYPLGFLFQAIVVPTGLIYLLSNTPLFRRLVTGEGRRRDHQKLFLWLLLIQLLVLGYELGRAVFIREPPTAVLGLLIVVTAGLLGGWRMSLAMGLVVALLHGTQLLVSFAGNVLWTDLRFGYETAGLWGALRTPNWRPLLLGHYVYQMWTIVPLWAGIVAGAATRLLGERRFSPLAAVILGSSIDLAAGALMGLSGVGTGLWMLAPSALVSGAATSAVALMVRGVQAEAARRRAEAAELARTQAELRALRAQINPHFLFNALNTIRYFVRTDPETARRLLIDLSEVFQRALRSGDLVPLRDEMAYVEAYLSLEKARLGDRLQVEWVVHAEEHLDQPVPTLILQPIVENAVIHGIAAKPEGGTMCISVEARDGMLVLRVEDTGTGMAPERLAQVLAAAPPPGTGRPSIGLRNVDQRLRALYGPAHGLAIESQAGQGTRVRFRIPIGAAIAAEAPR